jgi:hypothetical protein
MMGTTAGMQEGLEAVIGTTMNGAVITRGGMVRLATHVSPMPQVTSLSLLPALFFTPLNHLNLSSTLFSCITHASPHALLIMQEVIGNSGANGMAQAPTTRALAHAAAAPGEPTTKTSNNARSKSISCTSISTRRSHSTRRSSQK